MSRRTLSIDDRLYAYLLEHSLREGPELAGLRAETAQHAWARMQIAPEQGQFMALLVELTGARLGLEIGTFTGYSALWLAQAVGPAGRLVCCDLSEEWTAVGRPYWQRAGVAGRIDLRIGPALDTLGRLLDEDGGGRYDFAFIDADKENYPGYYERCLELLRPGGLLMVDNTLWGGSVVDPADRQPDTLAIREFNRTLRGDARVSLSLVPIGDGLTLARKR